MKRLFFLCLTLGLLVFAGIKIRNHFHIPAIPPGQTRLIAADGSETELGSFSEPYILVSCVQSWCGDCIREAPSIEALQQKFGKDRLAVVFISDEEPEKLRMFSRLSKTGLPVYRSPESLDALGIRVFPSTWLLGPDRKVLMARLEGFNWNSPEVHSLIR